MRLNPSHRIYFISLAADLSEDDLSFSLSVIDGRTTILRTADLI